MTGWRAFVLRLLRVPHAPTPPPGAPPRVFRASRRYFSFRLLLWWIGSVILVLAVAAIDIVLSINLAETGSRTVLFLIRAVSILGFVLLLLRLTLGYAVLKLDYELRWYMISDRAIRIREGILNVREKTIALANIQNTVVKQGPLQRLFGIANVEVTTAGGSSPTDHSSERGKLGDPLHVGVFRGVDNPQEIRGIIVEGVRRYRDAGLGDLDDLHDDDSAAELLAEVRLTREMLERRYNFL